MSNDKKEQGNPNENLEDENIVESSEDDVRSSIIDKYNLDEFDDEELINEMTTDKIDEQKKLKTAIRQKIDWRKKAETTSQKEEANEPNEQKTSKETSEETSEDVLEARIEAKFAERELKSLGLDDELKKEVEEYAKLKKVSINDAFNSPYIQFMKEEKLKEVNNDKASIGGRRRTQATKDYSDVKPTDFDLTTESGQKEFAEYEKHIKSQLG